MPTRRTIVSLAVVAAFVLLAAPALAEHKPSPPLPQLAAALKTGGYVLYLRHAMTERRPDGDPLDLDACPTQRNLSDQGRAAARGIGAAMRRLGIKTGQVLASPFCRTRETAYLAFGDARVESALLSRGNPKDPAERARLPGLKALLSRPPAAGVNTVLVGHSGLLDSLTKVHIDEAEMAVFQPLGAGRYRFVGRIRAEHWNGLAAAP